MSKLIWSDGWGNQYADGSLADGLLRHYLTPPPAPAAPPKPTWVPSVAAWAMLYRWATGSEKVGTEPPAPAASDFLRRLYAQLHRDRVAALPNPPCADRDDLAHIASPNTSFSVPRHTLLALADDGNGD